MAAVLVLLLAINLVEGVAKQRSDTSADKIIVLHGSGTTNLSLFLWKVSLEGEKYGWVGIRTLAFISISRLMANQMCLYHAGHTTDHANFAGTSNVSCSHDISSSR